jgi:hypothetical protein
MSEGAQPYCAGPPAVKRMQHVKRDKHAWISCPGVLRPIRDSGNGEIVSDAVGRARRCNCCGGLPDVAATREEKA